MRLRYYTFFFFNPHRTCLPIFKYPIKYNPPILEKTKRKDTFHYV